MMTGAASGNTGDTGNTATSAAYETLTVPDSALREMVDSRGALSVRFFESSELCDGTVVIGDRTFPVSRMMLAAASPFFAGALSSSFREGATKAINTVNNMPTQTFKPLRNIVSKPPINMPINRNIVGIIQTYYVF